MYQPGPDESSHKSAHKRDHECAGPAPNAEQFFGWSVSFGNGELCGTSLTFVTRT